MHKLFLFVLVASLTSACNTNKTMESANVKNPFPKDVLAPVSKKVPHEMTLHGDKRVDNYFWMKNRDSAEVIAHLQAENSYYEKMTAGWTELKQQVFKEMKGRVKEDDSTPPTKEGNYFYYARFETGKEYPIYCRKFQALTAKEEIILDVNLLAKDKKFTMVAAVRPSPSHEWIAYAVDHGGRRFFDIRFRNLKTGQDAAVIYKNTTGNFVWAADNQTIFYAVQNPETLRSEKIMRGTRLSEKAEQIYFEKNDIFSVGVSKSITNRYLFINSGSFDSSEVHYIEADKPDSEWKVFLPREKKHEYAVEDGGDGFYILTNSNAENFRLMRSSYKATQKSQWVEVIAHRKDTLISDMAVFKTHIALQIRNQGLTGIEIFDRKSSSLKRVAMPDPVYSVELSRNPEFSSDQVRIVYDSMVRPSTHFDVNLSSLAFTTVKQKEVPTYDPNLYTSERLWVKAADGVSVPVSLVHRKDLDRSKTAPLLLYGYGSYGYSTDPDFRSTVVSLLDRGFIYANAHVRGGSEMGRAWYEGGRMQNKKNTFSDFNAIAQYLVDKKYSEPSKLFAMGGSAGGLLMGAIVNDRPDLYRGIVSMVPFVDVLTTMLDPDIPLTTAEYEQWGNPNERETYNYIKSYSPYDNIKKVAYPAMLVVTGYHDSQVQYWEPAKYVAKVREYNTGSNPIMFKINMDAGHSGASGRFEALKEQAEVYAFLISIGSVIW